MSLDASTIEPDGETLDFGGFKVRVRKSVGNALFLQSDLGDGRCQRLYFTQGGWLVLESRNGGPWLEICR